jgi:hypothetical protein
MIIFGLGPNDWFFILYAIGGIVFCLSSFIYIIWADNVDDRLIIFGLMGVVMWPVVLPLILLVAPLIGLRMLVQKVKHR